MKSLKPYQFPPERIGIKTGILIPFQQPPEMEDIIYCIVANLLGEKAYAEVDDIEFESILGRYSQPLLKKTLRLLAGG